MGRGVTLTLPSPSPESQATQASVNSKLMRPLGFLVPAVGVCFPGYAAASKSINTGMNHAEKDGLSEFI